LPLPDNTFLNTPKYGREQAEGSNNPDGSFRAVTMPGKMLVLARVIEGVKFQGDSLCAYRGAVPDPDHKDIFHWDGDFWFVNTARDLVILSGENAVKVID